MTHPRVRKAVFPVAGLGTRFLPATKAMAKEMLTVADRPLIQHAVDEAAAAGIEQFIFVNGRGKHAIDDHFDLAFELERALERRGRRPEADRVRAMAPAPGRIVSVRQQQLLGLGHAVWCARYAVGDEPFAVILPDDVVLADRPAIGRLMERHGETGGNVVGVESVPRAETGRYGVLEPGADDGLAVEVRGLVEKPDPARAPSTLCVVGRYVLLPAVFDLLERQRPAAAGEIPADRRHGGHDRRGSVPRRAPSRRPFRLRDQAGLPPGQPGLRPARPGGRPGTSRPSPGTRSAGGAERPCASPSSAPAMSALSRAPASRSSASM